MMIGLGVSGAAAGTAGVMQFTSAKEMKELFRPASAGRRGVELASATNGDWALQRGTLFTAETGHVLKLVDVQVFPQKTPRPKYLRDKAFVAGFEVVKGGPLEGDKTYRFRHGEGGEFDMYLSANIRSKPLRMHAVFG